MVHHPREREQDCRFPQTSGWPEPMRHRSAKSCNFGGKFAPSNREEAIHYVPLLDEIEWVLKWQTVHEDIQNGTKKMNKNDGSSSNQSIWLDDQEEEKSKGRHTTTVPKRNWQVMGNKWEKDRIACEGVLKVQIEQTECLIFRNRWCKDWSLKSTI